MGARLVPAAMLAAMLAFATAAATVGGVPDHPAWWRAAVSLAVLGGIVPVIAAVNIRIVPVFARRDWPSLAWLRVQVVLTVAGAWLVYAGRLGAERRVVIAGSAAALAAGVLFTVNIVLLFRREPVRPAPPRPFPEQEAVDRLAIRFTRLSGVYLLVGLGIGLGIELRRPAGGRWDLVWAHAMLVGFFLSMAAGVCYHVLSRWTGLPWRWTRPIRLHLLLTTVGLPVMLLALATDRARLFEIAGPLQAAALALFLATIAPMVRGLPEPTRTAVAGAALFLVAGIALGSGFALDPALGARLRMAHAEINLFGWTGLLVSGVGYYLVPRFVGRALRWPRLATIQLALLTGGTVVGAAELAARGYGQRLPIPLPWAQGAIALAFLLFAAGILGTLRGPVGVRVPITRTDRRPRLRPQP